jgi:hypothetical protein
MSFENSPIHQPHKSTFQPLLPITLPNRLWRNIPNLPVADVANRYATEFDIQQFYINAFKQNRQIVKALGITSRGFLGNTLDTFMQAIEQIPFYPTAWGLCGLAAMEASWCATFPNHIKTLQNPNSLVRKFRDDFDRVEDQALLHPYSKKIQTPIDKYHKDHVGKDYTYVSKIMDKNALLLTYKELMWRDKLLVPIVLNFPEQGIDYKYTHWFYIDLIDETKNIALIVGDLLPFGIKNSYGLYVELDSLCQAVSEVLNFQTSDREKHLRNNPHRHKHGFKYNCMNVTFFNP